jgi:hypothetical protein
MDNSSGATLHEPRHRASTSFVIRGAQRLDAPPSSLVTALRDLGDSEGELTLVSAYAPNSPTTRPPRTR